MRSCCVGDRLAVVWQPCLDQRRRERVSGAISKTDWLLVGLMLASLGHRRKAEVRVVQKSLSEKHLARCFKCKSVLSVPFGCKVSVII